jgi:hypothetical protein
MVASSPFFGRLAMRRLALALLLACSGVAVAAEPPPEDEVLFLYNVAIFEFNGKRAGVPWKDFGQPQTLAEAVHKKTATGSVDTRAVRKLDIRGVAKYLHTSSGATLVANVPARPGDVVRAPCGFGTNVEVDFAQAAVIAGPASTLLVKVLEIDADVPDGVEFIGALSGAGSKPVDQTAVKFPTVEGDTFVVEVNRQKKAKDPRGCIVLVTP